MKRKFITYYKGFNIFDDGAKIVFFYNNFRFTADSVEEAQTMIDDIWEEGVEE